MTSAASWRMQGDILESCSCNVTCPCNYGGDPTELPCEAVLGFRIQEGNYGNTSLGNLNFVIYAQIPGKVFDGGWTLGVFLDERASQEQVEALGTILSGQAGGWFEPFSGFIANPLPPKQVAINFESVDGELRITIPGVLEAGSERIPNPIPGQPPLDTTVNDMVVPFFTESVHVRRSTTMKLTDSDMNFEYVGRSANISHFEYSGP